jgi:hypothetical protein
MNGSDTQIDDRELDRLADGELSPAVLRDLFARLDRTDDGWKRAALALLEAQTLQTACRNAVTLPTAAVAGPKCQPTRLLSRGRREVFAVAAALTVTCGLAWWTTPSTTENTPAAIPMAGDAVDPDESLELLASVQMTFANSDGEWSDPVTVPVIDADDPLAQAWLTMRPILPKAVREELTRRGQRVREEQTWVPVDLADGRVGMVPVTDLVVTPASLRDYQ